MEHEPIFPKALNAPQSTATIIGASLVRQAVEASRRSPRRRIFLPFHKDPDATLHRMLNAVQPYSSETADYIVYLYDFADQFDYNIPKQD